MSSTNGLIGLAVHDPLVPLQVRQEMELMADHRGVSIDLVKAVGNSTELDLGGGLLERQAAGRFFMDFVSGLDIDRRVYPLVDFSALSDNSYLGIRYSAVRTHVSKADGKVALVVFAGMKNGPLGSFPSDQSSYPFLLPDDLEQPVNSSLLLSSRLLHRAAYAAGLEQMLEGGAFEAVRDDDQTLQRLDAKAGQLRVYPCEYEGSTYEFRSEEFVIPVAAGAPLAAGFSEQALTSQCPECCCCALCASASARQGPTPRAGYVGPLNVEFDVDQVRQRWASYCTLSFSFKAKSSSVWQDATATFQFDLRTLFHLVKPTEQEKADCLLLGQVLWPWEQSAEVTPVNGLPGGLSETAQKEINAFVAYLIKQAVLEGLARKLSAKVPEQLLDNMPLAADLTFTPFQFEMPTGMALFAHQSTGAAFRIIDPPLLIAPGQRHTFRVEPAREGVTWAVEGLPGNLGEIGRIDVGTGEYRAPPAHAMGGQQVRVRVVATDPLSKQHSSILLTVVLATLTVNPLIQVCNVEDQLTFTADTLEGELRWTLAAAGEEGRGSVAPEAGGKRCTYTAGGLMEDMRTYMLDHIKVENMKGEARTVHVLVLQYRPELMVKIAAQLPDGSLQLEARYKNQVKANIQWTVPIEGSGNIDESGRYTPPGSVGARFVLVMAKWETGEGEDLSIYEGHLILPLPLSTYFDAIRRLDEPAGLRIRPQQASGE